MQSEDTLVRARKLDTATLATIHSRYYPEVYRYVRYRLSDEQVCEDIASEVFLRLLDALHKNKGPERNLRGWLFGTASNLVNDYFRSHYSRKMEPVEEIDQLSTGNSAEHHFDESWLQEEVRQALQQLTPEQQHVLALRFAGERSLEETANIMGKTITAVKALQFRAVTTLRRMLDKVPE